MSHAVPPAQYAEAAQEALAKLSPEERRCCRSEARDEHARLRTAPREDAMQSKLDASILSYDNKHFVRTETTLMNEGKSAIGTKLDRDSAAYKALGRKKVLHRASDRFW